MIILNYDILGLSFWVTIPAIAEFIEYRLKRRLRGTETRRIAADRRYYNLPFV